MEQQEHEQRAEHRVDLSPAAARHDERRVECDERRNAQRRAPAQPPVRLAIAKRRQREVAGDGHELHEHLHRHGRQPDTQRVRDHAQQAEHQHVRRGIIAEIARFIEVGRAAGGHLARPCGVAAHVHAVALDVHRQHQPHGEREHQQGAQRRRTAAAPARRRGMRRAQQRLRDERGQQQVYRRRAEQQWDRGCAQVRALRLRRLLLRLRRRQAEHAHAQRHVVRLAQLHVREPRLARRLGAVAAQAHADGDLLLPLARAGVERHPLPLSLRVMDVLARAVHAQKRDIRARLVLVAALRHHQRGEAVGRVLAHGHGLLKARVVVRGVLYKHGARAVRRRRRLQIRGARAGHPHAGLPAVGHAAGHGGKVPVDEQVALLRRLLPARAQDERARRGQDEDQCGDQRCDASVPSLHVKPPMVTPDTGRRRGCA